MTSRAHKRIFVSMKQERLFIRVSKKEKAAIKKAAKELNVSLAAFVLDAARYQINYDKEAPMYGHTSEERLARKAQLKAERIRTSGWMKPTPENMKWLRQQVRQSKTKGYNLRFLFYEEKKGKLTGQIALARKR